jgi:hypothetical protein
MPEYVQKPGTFTLFPNSYKKSENQPDLKGKLVTPEGKVYEIAAWKRGGEIEWRYTGTMQEPRPKTEQAEQPPARPVSHFTSDDDAPF